MWRSETRLGGLGDAMTRRAEKRARRDALSAAWWNAKKALEAGSPDDALQLLDSPWPQIRSFAVRELRKRGRTREVLPELIELVSHEESNSVVRRRAPRGRSGLCASV